VTRPISYRLRRGLAAGTTALALVALAGCGGDDDSPASDKTSSSPSASTSDDASPSAAASESPSDVASEGSGDAPEEGAELSADEFATVIKDALDQATTANVQATTGTAVNLTGQLDFTTDPPSAHMTGDLTGAGAVDMVLLDNVIYMKSKIFGSGDKWIKLDLDDPNSPLGALGDQLNPASSLENLVDGIKSATYVGNEDVDGEALDHYTAVIDTTSLLKGMPAAAAGSAGLPPTLNYEVWFDGDGFIRKFSVDMGTTGTSEGTFSDWGTPVDIAAPPASQVTSMPGM
jgi:LppX/LprAFG-like lipoprotein